jgi:hypothetical protein
LILPGIMRADKSASPVRVIVIGGTNEGAIGKKTGQQENLLPGAPTDEVA